MIDRDVLFGTPRAISMWVISAFFVVAFAGYFNVLADKETVGSAMGGGSSGSWDVSFIETLDTTSEGPTEVNDGESTSVTKTIAPETNMFGVVRIMVTCSDGGGIGDLGTDSFSAALTAPEGIDGGTLSGDCDGSEYELNIPIIDGYDGESYVANSTTEGEIRTRWSAGDGDGHGDWMLDVTVQTAGQQLLGPGGEDGAADVTMSISAITFDLDIKVA
ncbi:MAG: hypothetical protein CMB77_02015 [Euryarchaeota archaeon]|nr:hypothetical protein [Euryarchaeota archaeon]